MMVNTGQRILTNCQNETKTQRLRKRFPALQKLVVSLSRHSIGRSLREVWLCLTLTE